MQLYCKNFRCDFLVSERNFWFGNPTTITCSKEYFKNSAEKLISLQDQNSKCSSLPSSVEKTSYAGSPNPHAPQKSYPEKPVLKPPSFQMGFSNVKLRSAEQNPHCLRADKLLIELQTEVKDGRQISAMQQ